MTESRRERSKRETRQRIFQSARALFLEEGFEKTTMRDIAAKAGVGLGSVNLHFKDKSSLMHEVFYEEIETKSLEARNSLPQGSLKEQLIYLLEEEYGFYERHHPTFALVVKESFFVSGEWGDRYEKQLWEYATALARLFDAARERGEIRKGVESHAAATAFISSYLFGLTLGVRETPFDANKVMKQVAPMIHLLIEGMQSRKSDHES